MKRRLRRHPHTGELLKPVFITKNGIARYPILGASEDDPNDEDDQDDEDDELDDEAEKIYSKRELSHRLQREKKQGQRKLARDLGFDSVKSLQDHLEEIKTREEADLDEVAKREKAITEREAKAEQRERAAARRERIADVRSALSDEGVQVDDLTDALRLIDLDFDEDDIDEDDIADAVAALKERRAELFDSEAGDKEEQEERKAKAKARIPAAGPKRRNTNPGKEPGAYGRERARRRFNKD